MRECFLVLYCIIKSVIPLFASHIIEKFHLALFLQKQIVQGRIQFYKLLLIPNSNPRNSAKPLKRAIPEYQGFVFFSDHPTSGVRDLGASE
jgi:hypothetical protein